MMGGDEGPDARFEFGLDVIVQGLSTIAARSSTPPPRERESSGATTPRYSRGDSGHGRGRTSLVGTDRRVTSADENAVVGSPQTLSEADRRIVAVWAADCAERVLGIVRGGSSRRRRPP
jgi:hypothetical protein